MFSKAVDLFLRPTGEIGVKPYLIGVAGIAVFVVAVNAFLRALTPGALSFSVALVFPFLALYIIYCVYGKRLHDMGFSVWPLTALIAAELFVMIGVMLAFGGTEYFEGFAQYERKAVIDEAVRQALIADYQAKQEASMGTIKIALKILPALFTLWLALAPKRPRKIRT